ncbi:MAG: hypothetical protein DRJ42_15035 [Deltaproteobacteria bacterium]|nr:MAG: hypothetical protein DRJ42_15035 [Deltaproteobacteria bacterium]
MKRIARWVLGSLALVTVSLLVSIWLAPSGPERYSESLPIARAVLEEPDHVWPPVTPAPLRPVAAPTVLLDGGALPGGHLETSPLHRPPPSRPGFEVQEGEKDGIHYFEVVLGEAAFDDELPLVVVLHGRGSYAQIPGGPFRDLSHPVRLLIPQAPTPLHDGYQWIPVYVNQGLVDEFASTLFATAGRLARLIRDVITERGAMGRSIVTGFSQGGIVTLALALYHDDVVGAALPMSSWLPPPLEPAYRRADLTYPIIRAMHGNEDATVPITPTRELFARLAALDFDVVLQTFDGVGHETNAAMNELYHHWLEETVCRAAGDEQCAAAARHLGRVLTGDEPLDAGLDGALGDAGLDGAVGDGGLDGAVGDGGPDAALDEGNPDAALDEGNPGPSPSTDGPTDHSAAPTVTEAEENSGTAALDEEAPEEHLEERP